MKLSKRLSAVADHIPSFGGLADVGTDHGYIPVHVLQNGFDGAVVATDINLAPLDSAKTAAAEYGVSEKIEFKLCDGLSALDGEGIKTVVIAGMGGETITSILESAPWTRDDRLLILQPMSRPEKLRTWLFENGYKVLTEELCEDGAVYEILTATGGEDAPYQAAELMTGHFEFVRHSPLFPAKLEALIVKTRRAFEGLSSAHGGENEGRLGELERTLKELETMKNKLVGGSYAKS